mgnify:FL=1
MLMHGTIIERLDDWRRDRAGMLRRKVPLATLVRILVAVVAFAMFGMVALATGDPAPLLLGLIPILVVETALRLRR